MLQEVEQIPKKLYFDVNIFVGLLRLKPTPQNNFLLSQRLKVGKVYDKYTGLDKLIYFTVPPECSEEHHDDEKKINYLGVGIEAWDANWRDLNLLRKRWIHMGKRDHFEPVWYEWLLGWNPIWDFVSVDQ